VVNTAKVRIRINDLCYPSEQAVDLYREKESRYPLSLQQGEVAKVNAGSDGERLHKQVSFDGRSVYTNNMNKAFCLLCALCLWTSLRYSIIRKPAHFDEM
jgi:hypothetical protein